MTDLKTLRARAADQLDFAEPWIRHAWTAVPRHQFVPDTVWVVEGGVYRPLRRDDDQRWARMVYDPVRSIAAQADDGAPAGDGGDVPTSSISEPRAVMSMLAELFGRGWAGDDGGACGVVAEAVVFDRVAQGAGEGGRTAVDGEVVGDGPVRVG
ncbi:hypothetical protein [Streptomyces sp. NPDC019937]|uniref:hypothetical protein n=1 Tax=Streptomyces sp. NPDC019937 TaxID=3154787 RepID=UPI0033F9792D